MMMMNCVKTIAIHLSQKISCKSFKNKIINKLSVQIND